MDTDPSEYEGALDKNKRKEGEGIGKWEDGSVYEGNWSEDKRHGKGKLTCAVRARGTRWI
jgi:hypothetical protein